jgi:hypothetical protein
LIAKEIFRVLYSPVKAFEEIAQAPDVKGPLLILLITLLASASAQYISSSKTLLQEKEESSTYIPLTTTDLFHKQLISTLTDTTFRFFLNWLLYGITFLPILKLFKAKEGPWTQLFILIGYTFIVAAVFLIIRAILIATFPPISFNFQTWTQAFLEREPEAQNRMLQEFEKHWVTLPAFQIGSYLFVAVETWTTTLSAVAIHFLREVSWTKSLIISAIASAISLFLRFPLIL